MVTDSIRLHTAPWVVPVCRSIIPNGGVAFCGDRIIAVDEQQHLLRQYPQAEVFIHHSTALTPALINAHHHLELSHLGELSAVTHKGSFTSWICQLLALRDTLGAAGELAEQAALQAANDQYRSGVSALADIGNTSINRKIAATFPGTLFPFKEYLGLATFTLEKNLLHLRQETDAVLCSAHAPYSTHPRLLQALKARAVALGYFFPIHTAEPEAEGTMIREGRGEMVDFVRQRGFWDDSFVPKDKSGSVHYLHDMGLLDDKTLCIHAIHVSSEEIRILAGQGCKVCLCPGSNQFLGTGKAPVPQYLENGILPALGTDSLASNPELSIWREMQILAQQHPSVDAADLFSMATIGGAQALSLDSRLGTLEPGKDVDILAVPVPADLTTASQVYNHLVSSGSTIAPVRITH
jgi:cytosine/adenosine deaminase-related metal-dependent hydrolase